MSGALRTPDRELAALQLDGQPKKLILLVEDSYAERLAIRAGIEAFTDFRVCEASNGAQGILKAKELKPDLILLDLAMPIMNGLAAALVFKTQMPNIPVVILTIHADGVPQRKRALLGLKAVLDKTDGLSPLLDCLRKILEPNSTA
jgi:CheY-like chemotaxis protein